MKGKMYTYRKIDKKLEDNRCKGRKKCVVAESLTFDDCKTCLFEGETIYREQMLYTVNKHKIDLKEDNKRRVEADGVTTRGYLA